MLGGICKHLKVLVTANFQADYKRLVNQIE